MVSMGADAGLLECAAVYFISQRNEPRCPETFPVWMNPIGGLCRCYLSDVNFLCMRVCIERRSVNTKAVYEGSHCQLKETAWHKVARALAIDGSIATAVSKTTTALR